MTIYFQHVGQRGGASHFPLTIGTRNEGLKKFKLADIEKYIVAESKQNIAKLEAVLGSAAPEGFQIWGAPSGARSVLRNIAAGDWLLLLESDRPGGQFYYGGKVLYRFERENFELSEHLWGDANFPIIILLGGNLTNYGWENFRENFGFGAGWRLQGRTYRLTPERLAQSPFLSEEDVIESVIGSTAATAIADDLFGGVLDQVEVTYPTMEGRRRLREHIVRERDPNLIRRFKTGLRSFECSICKFNFESVYGKIGEKFIEAHHVDPIGFREENEVTDIADLIAVCSNCHRMLHKRSPPFSAAELSDLIIEKFGETPDRDAF